METNSMKSFKSGRVSKTQRRRLLELMKQHRSVGKGQFVTKDAKREHNAVWAAVSKELNAIGGSLKTPDQWKKSWIDWKASVKQQYGRLRAFANRTGNLPSSEGPKEMVPIDKEVLEFFSKDVVNGDGHTLEGGLENIEPIVEAIYDVDDDIIVLDESQLAVEDAENVQQFAVVEKPARSRETSNKSCLEEVKKACDKNQTEVMGALHQIINLIELQNNTLGQILKSLENKM